MGIEQHTGSGCKKYPAGSSGRAMRSKYFLLNFHDQLAWLHVQRNGDAPNGFKIRLLGAVFNHGQVGTGNPCKAAEQFLGHAFLNAKLTNDFSDDLIIELYTTTTFLTF